MGFKKRSMQAEDAKPVLGRVPNESELSNLAAVAARLDSGAAHNAAPPPANTTATEQLSAQKVSLLDVRVVPLPLINENRFNSRQVFSANDHDDMVKRLKSEGQLEDCVGYVDGSVVVLYSGHRRLRAARELGWQSLRVKIISPPRDEFDAYVSCDQFNAGHKQQTDLDRALAYAKLIEHGKVSGVRELTTRLIERGEANVSEALISKLISLSKLPPEVTASVADVPTMLTYTVLYEITMFFKDHGLADTLKLLANVRDTPLSSREIASRRKALAAPPQVKPRSNRHSLVFAGAKAELRTWDETGRLELQIRGLLPEHLSKLETKIAALFEQQAKPVRSSDDAG